MRTLSDAIKFREKTPISYAQIQRSLPENIKYASDLNLINSQDLNILAVPTHALYDSVKEINIKNSNFLVLSKGYDMDTGLLPSQLLTDQLNIDEVYEFCHHPWIEF